MNNDVYVGVDPGISGAIAFIQGKKIAVYDFEDPIALKVLQSGYLFGDAHALIERVHAMPKQGISSTAKFMTTFGQWIGRLEALSISFGFTTPQKWQQAMFGSAPKIYKLVTVEKGYKTPQGEVPPVKAKKVDTKAMSLQTARQMFPVVQDRLTRQKDNDRADALLIAEFCKRLNEGKV